MEDVNYLRYLRVIYLCMLRNLQTSSSSEQNKSKDILILRNKMYTNNTCKVNNIPICSIIKCNLM